MSLFQVGRLGVLTETLTGARTLTSKELLDYCVMALDPGGASRTVTLPANSDNLDGHAFIIENAANAEEIITIVNSTPTTLCTITQGESALVYHRGSPSGGWKAVKLDANVVTAGTVTASRALVVDSSKQLNELKFASQTVNPAADSGAGSTILPGVRSVTVGAVVNDANDWIVLPALSSVPDGHEITILCSAGGNFEMRTPASSAAEINSEDCDGTKEYLMTDTQVVKVVKINNNIGWMAHGYSAIGAVVTAVIPD